MKKFKAFCGDDPKPVVKLEADVWVLKPGKGGMGKNEPGIGILIDDPDMDMCYEGKISRSELQELLDEMDDLYPGYAW